MYLMTTENPSVWSWQMNMKEKYWNASQGYLNYSQFFSSSSVNYYTTNESREQQRWWFACSILITFYASNIKFYSHIFNEIYFNFISFMLFCCIIPRNASRLMSNYSASYFITRRWITNGCFEMFNAGALCRASWCFILQAHRETSIGFTSWNFVGSDRVKLNEIFIWNLPDCMISDHRESRSTSISRSCLQLSCFCNLQTKINFVFARRFQLFFVRKLATRQSAVQTINTI